MRQFLRKIQPFSWILVSLFLMGCFGGVKKTGKVVGYREGRVLTKKGSYDVGSLPAGWERIKLGKAVVTFYNPSLKSSISTDSFCDQAYNDSPLKSLTRHLFPGLQDQKVMEQEPLTLSGRGALHTVLKATMDGVPVMLSIVVVKKDWCLFDFYLVSEQSYFAQAAVDFEAFYRGFQYQGGD